MYKFKLVSLLRYRAKLPFTKVVIFFYIINFSLLNSQMNYVKVQISTVGIPDYMVDVITYNLGEIGFDSFETDSNYLCSYVKQTVYDDKSLKTVLQNNKYSTEIITSKNWNEEWEKNYFQPIVIEDKCVIRSSFHTNVPDVQYNILIDPKMSFGTGHHETTSSMISWILEDDMTNKSVLDMGCGTGILGILAKMKNASSVIGVDVDPWCVSNATENTLLNNVDMKVILGDAESLSSYQFDVIFANINRNILLADMNKYVGCLKNGGCLYMSGFYSEDLAMIREKAESLGLTYVSKKDKHNWVAAKFVK